MKEESGVRLRFNRRMLSHKKGDRLGLEENATSLIRDGSRKIQHNQRTTIVRIRLTGDERREWGEAKV